MRMNREVLIILMVMFRSKYQEVEILSHKKYFSGTALKFGNLSATNCEANEGTSGGEAQLRILGLKSLVPRRPHSRPNDP